MKSAIPVIVFALAGMVTLPQSAPAQPVPADAPIMRHSAPRTDKTRLRPRHVVPKPTQVYVPDPDDYHGYVPNNWGTYCGQLAKAC